jgi:hypothetical protein
MAKGNPNSATVQYKVHLKPTEIGLLVIKRLERPHMDVSPELRRLIELGYAAEQAGFILDGTVLRHAGRSWETQPDLGSVLPGGDGLPHLAGLSNKTATTSRHTRREELPTSRPNPSTSQPESIPEPVKEQGASGKETLKGNLRGLSG